MKPAGWAKTGLVLFEETSSSRESAVQDRQLYAQILGIAEPWLVEAVDLRLEKGEVVVRLKRRESAILSCPKCGRSCPGYDHQVRRWRHLDTCQYQTILEAPIPRCECPDHGVHQIAVPWAEEKSRFTALFEALAIDWMRVASQSAVARQLGLSWWQAHGIMKRAVERGLRRRDAQSPVLIGVDEKSFQKGHEYVTVVCDLVEGNVLYVGDDRSKASLDAFYEGLNDEEKQAVQAVAMDMCQAYISSTCKQLPQGETKIVFDKFHLARNLSDAVDKVRRAENKRLRAEGDTRLVGTKYDWLRNPLHESRDQSKAARPLRESLLATARAWRLKETFMDFFRYQYPANARKFFTSWYAWAIRSRLEPIKRVARTFKSRLDQLLNYIKTPITNATSESLNAKIQWIKYSARGFRSRDGFRNAIYFHCGGLDLYPHKTE